MHYLYQEFFIIINTCSCVIYSTAITKLMVFQSILHLCFEDQYRKMSTHENVVNMFIYCVSMCVNFCLDLQSGHKYKVIIN